MAFSLVGSSGSQGRRGGGGRLRLDLLLLLKQKRFWAGGRVASVAARHEGVSEQEKRRRRRRRRRSRRSRRRRRQQSRCNQHELSSCMAALDIALHAEMYVRMRSSVCVCVCLLQAASPRCWFGVEREWRAALRARIAEPPRKEQRA